jgi:LmbE family N-acetylglucosaminyl deacetylase
MNKVMVIAVHPDDETLGCGGTLLKHKSSGDEIHWVIVTSAKSFPGISCKDLSDRDGVIEKVSKMFKFDSVTRLELPTTKLDTLEASHIVELLSDVIQKVQPSYIYLPFMGDVHSDHRVVFECAYSCTKSFRSPFIKKIYMMETLSETEFAPSVASSVFIPNSFVDISRFFEQKIRILLEYKSEMSEHPFPRSVESVKALATLRGSTCSSEYAESFMLLKEIS